MTGNAMKPQNARAREIIVSHIREFIEEKGIEAAKAAGFARGVHKRNKYPCDGWHEDAREIAKKILADKEFIRFCRNDGESPEKVVDFNWFYRHIKTAQVITGIGKPMSNSCLTVHKVAKTIEEKQGLYLEFEDVELAGRLFETVRIDGDDIPGHFEHFVEQDARDIATRHVVWAIKKFRDHGDEVLGMKDESIEDILGGIKVADLYQVTYERLERIARHGSASQTRKLNLSALDNDKIGNLMFGSLAGVKVFYCDIVCALMNRICGVIDRKDDKGLCFPTKLGKVQGKAAVLEKQNCVGSIVKDENRDPSDFERTLRLDNYYIIDQFGMPSLYDLNVKTDGVGDEYKKLPLGDTGRDFRRLKMCKTKDSNGDIDIFAVCFRMVGKSATDNHKISTHRLLQINAMNLGMGMDNNSEFKTYLGDSTFEEAFPYTAQDERAYERKLESRGWERVKFAKTCDVDHLVGRKELWMNMTIFTMPCSHRWNRCMCYVRLMAGHWCFALGFKSYTGGN